MASLNIPFTFTNGTTASAIEVNSNMQAIKSFVESQLVQIDGSVKASANSLSVNSVTEEKIATNAVTNSKINYSSVPQTTVSTSDPTGGKNGDIWVKVI
jgi:hypothetical protein